MKSKEIHLTQHFVGPIKPDYFEIAEVELPDPQDGEVQVANEWLSVDPYMRGRMIGIKTYIDPFQPGEPLEGGAVGRVVASKSDKLKEGDYVFSMLGWREGFTAPADVANPVDAKRLPAQHYLGIAGMPGLTAYAGIKRIIDLQAGETIWVSAAAGAVGSAACQFAKALGATVIGTAGGAAKMDFLNEIGVDAAVDYRAVDDLKAALRQVAPKGIHAYFENVGGDHLEAALSLLRNQGRVAACGMIARYNDDRPVAGPSNLVEIVAKSLKIQGYIVFNHFDLMEPFINDVAGWLADGTVKPKETIYEGVERMPEAFMRLFTGENVGKMLVKV